MTDTSLDGAMLAAAAETLRHWGMTGAPLKMISVSENVVFRVESPAGSYTLRLHRPGYHTLPELESEQMWTEALVASGIPAPLGIITKSGERYVPVAIPGTDQIRYAGMARWIDGSILGEQINGDTSIGTITAHYQALGALMATMHEQACAWQLPAGFTRHAFDADGLMGDAPFWGPFWQHPQLSDNQRALVMRTRTVIRRRLSTMPKSKSTYSLIHADLHAYNVLIDGDVLRVLDFDDAGFGFHMYDVAVALFHFQEHAELDAIRDAVVAGYRTRRALADDDLASLPMFFVIRALALLGWMDARPELKTKPESLAKRIRQTCDQCEALLQRESSATR